MITVDEFLLTEGREPTTVSVHVNEDASMHSTRQDSVTVNVLNE